MRFAETTTVPPEKSKMEIERILARYGATSFASGWMGGTAVICFEAHGRRVRFNLPLPNRSDEAFTLVRKGAYTKCTKEVGDQRFEQCTRQRWRALCLAIKAKLEVVESQIASFEEEFLAHIVLPNGENVGEWIAPHLKSSYERATMPPLLGSGSR